MWRVKQIRQLLMIVVVILCFLTAAGIRANWQEQQKLISGDANNYDYFGYSVSIDGDYAVVGARYSDIGGPYDNRGAAYIFKRTGTTWAQQDKLAASDAQPGDSFGCSVSISGDYAIVGAYTKDSHTGAAYIFERSGTNWSQQAKLTASDGAINDEFGYSVSISGDYAIVGAYGDTDMGKNQCGSAYIFENPPTGWADTNEMVKLFAFDPGPTAGERFGYSVAIDANTVIVGADLSSPSPELIWAGAAYIFIREGIYWNPQHPKLIASDASGGDNFGRAVAIDCNYAIVGATGDDIDAVNGQTGCAYIFKHIDGPIWTEKDILFASDPCKSDYFGSSVSIIGDYAFVGAPAAFKPGAGYLYRRSGTNWPQLDKLTVLDVNSTDAFGCSVSIDSGYAVVGAYTDDSHGTAYTFEQICPTADLSNDCEVNFFDYAFFASWWLGSCSGPDWCSGADLDQSTAVDFNDLDEFTLQWLDYN